jgi:hypothetical protein
VNREDERDQQPHGSMLRAATAERRAGRLHLK